MVWAPSTLRNMVQHSQVNSPRSWVGNACRGGGGWARHAAQEAWRLRCLALCATYFEIPGSTAALEVV